MKLKEAVIGAKLNENDRFPCSVTAAIACSNYYSTLEILEKHVVKKDRAGMTLFDRELFSLLQRLYYNLNDVENTQGAYLHIINNAVPSPSETILNLEISGNIVEILPMISSKENQVILRFIYCDINLFLGDHDQLHLASQSTRVSIGLHKAQLSEFEL